MVLLDIDRKLSSLRSRSELSRGKETARLAAEVKQLEEEEEVARLRAAGVGGKRKRPKRG